MKAGTLQMHDALRISGTGRMNGAINAMRKEPVSTSVAQHS